MNVPSKGIISTSADGTNSGRSRKGCANIAAADRDRPPYNRAFLEGFMAEKLTDIPDQDLKAMMKAIARANGRPLSDERVDIDLPA